MGSQCLILFLCGAAFSMPTQMAADWATGADEYAAFDNDKHDFYAPEHKDEYKEDFYKDNEYKDEYKPQNPFPAKTDSGFLDGYEEDNGYKTEPDYKPDNSYPKEEYKEEHVFGGDGDNYEDKYEPYPNKEFSDNFHMKPDYQPHNPNPADEYKGDHDFDYGDGYEPKNEYNEEHDSGYADNYEKKSAYKADNSYEDKVSKEEDNYEEYDQVDKKDSGEKYDKESKYDSGHKYDKNDLDVSNKSDGKPTKPVVHSINGKKVETTYFRQNGKICRKRCERVGYKVDNAHCNLQCFKIISSEESGESNDVKSSADLYHSSEKISPSYKNHPNPYGSKKDSDSKDDHYDSHSDDLYPKKSYKLDKDFDEDKYDNGDKYSEEDKYEKDSFEHKDSYDSHFDETMFESHSDGYKTDSGEEHKIHRPAVYESSDSKDDSMPSFDFNPKPW